MSAVGFVSVETIGRRRWRLVIVALAVVAPLALWAIVEYGFALDLRSPAFGDGETVDVGAAQVVVAALIGSVLGWASLASLERLTTRAAKLWASGALVALLISLGGPLGGSGIGWTNRAVLVAMHILVTLVLVFGFSRTSTRGAAVAPAVILEEDA